MSLPAKRSGPGFDPERLVRHLCRNFPKPDAYWVGFSGGLDSTVLLQALAEQRRQLSAPLQAIHIDHGLQDDSGDWAVHCQAVCDQLGVPLIAKAVDARPARGESPEAAARAARYGAIRAVLPPRTLLLTAHHLDDQAETVLLQLLRGAGVAGLAAMPPVRPFAPGWHGRPLLGQSRQDLSDWAGQHGQRWLEDPSNASITPDRNFLRHAVLPTLRTRWPAASQSLARSAGHCAGALEALRQQAEEDLGRTALSADRIDLVRFAQLSAFRQRALLLRWLQRFGVPAPSAAQMQEVLEQLLQAGDDAAVCFSLGEYQLRRYANAAWMIHTPPLEPTCVTLPWPAGQAVVELEMGAVQRRSGAGGIPQRYWDDSEIQIGFRREGLRCQPAGRQGRRTFKAISQENGIPPWQRPFLPVIWVDGQVAAIANCCVCEPFVAGPGEPGWLVEWSVDRAR